METEQEARVRLAILYHLHRHFTYREIGEILRERIMILEKKYPPFTIYYQDK